VDSYSTIADQQLNELEDRDPELYDAVLTVCEGIFDNPEQAQSVSRAITTNQGIRMVLSVPGFPAYKVFWSTDGPRVEAVFPYDFRTR
jgi:hypothetical protein